MPVATPHPQVWPSEMSQIVPKVHGVEDGGGGVGKIISGCKPLNYVKQKSKSCENVKWEWALELAAG